MYNTQTHFANRLKQLRLAARLTQDKLAKELNVSRSCLANYERGNRFPDADILSIISDYFKVNTDYLLSEGSHVCTGKKRLINANELLKDFSATGQLDISNISPLSRIVLFEFYNFLCEQERYSDNQTLNSFDKAE